MYLINILGSSAHKFYGVLGSWGGVAKMFENIFFENDEQKIKIKNTEKAAKFVSQMGFWQNLWEGKKNVWEKIRESSVYVFVCGGLRLLWKKGTVLHLPQKHPSTAPSHLAR